MRHAKDGGLTDFEIGREHHEVHIRIEDEAFMIGDDGDDDDE